MSSLSPVGLSDPALNQFVLSRFVRFRRGFVGALAAVMAILVAGGLAVVVLREIFDHDRVFGLARLFDLDLEANVPAWYSSVSLFLCSAVLALLAWLPDHRRGRGARQWGALAAVFLLLSLDESASLHELAGEHLMRRLAWTGLLFYTWVVPGMAFAAGIAIWAIPFLRALPAESRRRFVGSGLVYCSGALGMEMLNGWYRSQVGGMDAVYWSMTVVEEGLEMAGIVLFMSALLRQVETQLSGMDGSPGTVRQG